MGLPSTVHPVRLYSPPRDVRRDPNIVPLADGMSYETFETRLLSDLASDDNHPDHHYMLEPLSAELRLRLNKLDKPPEDSPKVRLSRPCAHVCMHGRMCVCL